MASPRSRCSKWPSSSAHTSADQDLCRPASPATRWWGSLFSCAHCFASLLIGFATDELYTGSTTSNLLMYLHRSAPFKRAFLAFGFAAACIACAVFLRAGKGHGLREAITLRLGYEWRAAVEHLLTAIGFPLAAAFLFLALLLTSCWLSYVVCKWAGWTWKPLAKHPREVASFECFAFGVCITSLVYFLVSVTWEWDQAFGAVYGGAARTYIQWDQVCSDVLGALVSVCIALTTSSPRAYLKQIFSAGHRPHRYPVEHGIAEGVASSDQELRSEPTTNEA